MILRELFAKLGLKVDGAGFERGEALVSGIKSGLVAIAGLATAAAAGLGLVVHQVASAADKVDELSQSTGVSTDTLQELAHAGAYSSLTMDDMGMALGRLARGLRAAKGEGEGVGKAFRDLGVRTRDGAGELRPTEDVLLDLADAFQAMPDGTEKTALAMEIFGRSGARLIPLLNEGSDGIERLSAEARDLGVVLDEEAIKRGVAFDDSMTRLKATLQGLRNTIGVALLEPVRDAIEAFSAWARANREVIKARVEKVVKILGAAFRLLWRVLKPLLRVMGLLLDNFQLVAVVVGSALVASLLTAAGGFNLLSLSSLRAGAAMLASGLRAALGWAAAAAPVVILTGLIALIVLLVEDMYTALTGGESLIGKLWDKWSDFLEDWYMPREDDPWWLAALKTLLFVITHLGEAWDTAIDFWKGLFQDLWDWITDSFAETWAGVVKGYEELQISVLELQGLDDAAKMLRENNARRDAAREAIKMMDRAARDINTAIETEKRRAAYWSDPRVQRLQAVSTADYRKEKPRTLEVRNDVMINVAAAPGQKPEEVAGAARQEFDEMNGRKLNEALRAVED